MNMIRLTKYCSRKGIGIFMLLILNWNNSFAWQSNLDSLNKCLNGAATEQEKIRILREIFTLIKDSDPEAAIYNAKKQIEYAHHIGFWEGMYAGFENLATAYLSKGNQCRMNGEPENALNWYKKSLELGVKFSNRKSIGFAYYGIGTHYDDMGEYVKAREYLDIAVMQFKEADEKDGLMRTLYNYGVVYLHEANYPKAIETMYQTLSLAEANKDTLYIADTYKLIGYVHMMQKSHQQALDYYSKADAIYSRKNRTIQHAEIALYSGGVQYDLKQYPKALASFKVAETTGLEQNDTWLTGNAYVNMAKVFSTLGSFDSALHYSVMAARVFEEMKSHADVVAVKNVMSEIYLLTGKYDLAETTAKEALRTADEINYPDFKRSALKFLHQIYSKQGQYQKAYEMLMEFNTVNDTLNSRENIRQLTEAGMMHEFEKEKQVRELENLRREELQNARLRQQQIVIYSVIFGLLLLVFLLFFVFKSYRIQKKAHHEMREKNAVITKQREEIQVQNDALLQSREEIMAQNEEIVFQRDEIIRQKKEIIDSINYASKIQNAVLPSLDDFSQLVPQHFVLFKPRDIVSGDFYWIKQIRNFTVIAIADCTGHGVPGAFMSMLGMSFLNEVVSKTSVDNTGQILNQLRKRIKQTLKQYDPEVAQKDGMDMVLISLDMETLELQYSGANNSLYIIRSNERGGKDLLKMTEEKRVEALEGENEVLLELKPDRQPVAVHVSETDFSTRTIQLRKDDVLYACSDGYADQSGGERSKKFMSKNFKKTLMGIYNKPLSEQKMLLEQNFETWKGNHEQTDDVLVIGVRV